MASPLENLALRLEADPFFLACALKHYAASEGLDEEKLAGALGCSPETLVMIQLCRAPAPGASQFQKDIGRVASRFEVDPDVLAQAVRRGQAMIAMARTGAGQRGTLVAARDADKTRDAEKNPGGAS